MKLTIIAGELAKASGWAARLVPGKPIKPVLAGVMLTASPHHLTISASDFESFASVIAPAETGEPGQCAVSAYLLSAVAETLPASAEVSLVPSGGRLSVRCGRYSASLPMLDTADWPPFPALGEELGSVRGPELRECLSRVLVAVDPDAKHPALTGVTLDLGAAALIATDGRRMAVATLPWQPVIPVESAAEGVSGDQPLILPEPVARFALDIMNGGDVSLYSDGNTISVVTPSHQITGRLISGQIPGDWQALMAAPLSRTSAVATVESGALRSVVKQVSAVTGRESKIPPLLRLSVEGESIRVSLADGDSAAETAADLHGPLAGEPVTTGMTVASLLDALRCLGSPMVTITFQRDSDDGLARPQPFLLCPADVKGTPLDDGYRHLIVPRRIEVPE